MVSARDQIITRPLVNQSYGAGKAGRIVVSAEEVEATANAEIVMFDPIANIHGESGLCFFIIYRNISLGQFTPIYKSEIKRPTAGHVFKWN